MPAHYPSISKIDSPDTMKGATNSLLGSMGSTSKITDTYAAKLHEQLGSLGLDEEGFLTAVEDSRETAFGLAPHLLAAAGGNFSYVLQDEEGGKEEDAAALADQVINTHPSLVLMDFSLRREITGIEVMQLVLEHDINIQFIGFSSGLDRKREFAEYGVGFVEKNAGEVTETIGKIIEEVRRMRS